MSKYGMHLVNVNNHLFYKDLRAKEVKTVKLAQIPEDAINEYMAKDEEWFISGDIADFKYSFMYKIDSYYNKPYFYFTIENDI